MAQRQMAGEGPRTFNGIARAKLSTHSFQLVLCYQHYLQHVNTEKKLSRKGVILWMSKLFGSDNRTTCATIQMRNFQPSIPRLGTLIGLQNSDFLAGKKFETDELKAVVIRKLVTLYGKCLNLRVSYALRQSETLFNWQSKRFLNKRWNVGSDGMMGVEEKRKRNGKRMVEEKRKRNGRRMVEEKRKRNGRRMVEEKKRNGRRMVKEKKKKKIIIVRHIDTPEIDRIVLCSLKILIRLYMQTTSRRRQTRRIVSLAATATTAVAAAPCRDLQSALKFPRPGCSPRRRCDCTASCDARRPPPRTSASGGPDTRPTRAARRVAGRELGSGDRNHGDTLTNL
ncbi:Protein of unknown function [Gryllus bimaculatus]|nr:Protein of unknown function [Gryllus bimaculatus]